MGSQTALYSVHKDEGAKLVDFAGWDMPLQYTSIIAEHKAVRTTAGLFDVGHMGRLFLRGAGAAETIHQWVVSRITDMKVGQVRYTVVCNERGAALDDILVTRLASDRFLLVVNASNREKLLPWFRTTLPGNVELDDQTTQTGMLAVQGPEALRICSAVLEHDVSALGYYTAIELPGEVIVSRTGYTGEDGYEIIAPNDRMAALWSRAREEGAVATGLGCRDSLRLEMGFPLYGHELSESITPLEAGLKRVVHFDKDSFIGKEALERQRDDGIPRKRIGFVLNGPGVPRQGCPVLLEDQVVGESTSGGFSHVLGKGIGLALIDRNADDSGSLKVEIRGRAVDAEKTRPPFVEKRVKK